MTYTAPGKGPALFPLPLPLAHQRERGRRPTPEPAPPAGRAGGQIIARPGAGANTERTQKPHNSPENHNSAATIDCAADSLPVPFGPDKLRPAGRESRCWLLTWHRGLLTLVFLKVNNVLFVCLFLLLPCALCQLQRLRISAADKAPVKPEANRAERSRRPTRPTAKKFLSLYKYIYIFIFLSFLSNKGGYRGEGIFLCYQCTVKPNTLLNQGITVYNSKSRKPLRPHNFLESAVR